MNILLFLPHPEPKGHIGGALFRTIEILRKAKKYGMNYIVIENKPSFKGFYGLDYEGHEIDVHINYKSKYSFCKLVGGFIKAGIKIVTSNDIDIIVSPLESPFSVFSAYVTSKITAKPWTAVLQSVPGYWYITNKSKKYSPSFIDIYRHLNVHKYFGDYVFFGALTRWLIYKLLRDTTSLTVSKSVVENINVVDEKIKIIDIFPGNGIDFERIFAVPTPCEKNYDAIFAGAIIPEKGIFDIIKAWSYVVKANPSSKLCIVGKGDKNAIKKLHIIIRKMKLENNVIFPYNLEMGADTLEDVWSLMKKSKILIYPSIIDAWPLVVGEALACSLPVIAYDVPPIKYSYGKCSAVFCVESGNVELFAMKILNLLSNKNLLKECSRQAINYARQCTWDNVIKSEKKAYRYIIEQNKTS